MTISKNTNELTWQYENKPPSGSNVLLLTVGGVPVIGDWGRNESYVAWCSLPSSELYNQSAGNPSGGSKVLLLTVGGVTIIGDWRSNAGFTSWAYLPKREAEIEFRLKLFSNKTIP